MKYAIILLGILVLALAACAPEEVPTQAVPAPGVEDVEEMIVVEDGDAMEDKSGDAMTDGDAMEDTTNVAASEQVITVTAKRWEFIPNPITVKKGIPVKLVITSVDVSHGFSLPAFNINQRLSPGNTVNIEFTPDKEGSFSFFCNVFCGSGHGSMRGTLIVES